MQRGTANEHCWLCALARLDLNRRTRVAQDRPTFLTKSVSRARVLAGDLGHVIEIELSSAKFEVPNRQLESELCKSMYAVA